MTNKGDNLTFTTTTTAERFWDTTVTPTVQTAKDEVQTVTITGTPTGGTFTLTFGGQTTSAIAYNATAATVQAALIALSSILTGNVVVTGGPGPGTAYTVEFKGTLGIAAQAVMTASGAGLTGGTSPSVVIAETQLGSTWATVSTGYTVQFCGGIVVFNTAVGLGTTSCRVTYNYLTISQALQAKSVDIQVQQDIADITTFASGGWKVKLPLLADVTVKLAQWWIDVFYITNMGNLLVLVMYSGANANQQFACYGYLKTDGIKFDVKGVIEEALDFESHGAVYSINS